MENLEPKFEQKKSESLKEAIKQRDVDKTMELLREINKELTGAKDVFIDKLDLDNFLYGQRLYFKLFLGDGGMSRLIIYNDKGNIDIEISSNSSKEVINKWQEL